ncbi:MAG: ribosome assembly RNA-binding protein YhbY [Xanthomonadales bacterium]|nr:ribosome assembly RNA-binding protein YhbY [Xanthomonadales bacterium]
MPLSNSQRRYLRGLAHHLKVIVMIGSKGLSETVLKELDRALLDHELVKVKVGAADREDRAGMIKAMAEASQAEIVQSIGHTVCLYRAHPENPQLALPA